MFPDLALPALMGVLLGAAAHRAGLCTVKAVAEVMTTGRAHVLWSFLKASFWTLGILSVAGLFGAEPQLSARAISLAGLGGGLVFGIGAGLNGACSFSTLARLAEGHGVMLATLAGWALGLLAMRGLAPAQAGAPASSVLPAWLILPGLAWILWEGVRLASRLFRNGRRLFEEGYWPLSLGVLVIAVGNAGLLLMDRPWSFTSTAICATGAARAAPCAHPGTLWTVSVAALLTMIVSARLRGSFRLRPMGLRPALRRLGAGSLMGAGAAMIPGGNDGLVLFGVPALSPHALPVLLGIVGGVWLVLATMRSLGARVPTILCESDICRASP